MNTRVLGSFIALLPLSLTACPSLLSDDFRVVYDGGGGSGNLEGVDGGRGLDGSTVVSEASSASDAHSSETETGADTGSDASPGTDAGDGAPPAWCCATQGTSSACTNTSGSYWVCFNMGQTLSCAACAAGEICQFGNQNGLIPGDTGSVEVCP